MELDKNSLSIEETEPKRRRRRGRQQVMLVFQNVGVAGEVVAEWGSEMPDSVKSTEPGYFYVIRARRKAE